LVRSKSSDLFTAQAPSHLVEVYCFKVIYHEIFNNSAKEKVSTILNKWLVEHLK